MLLKQIGIILMLACGIVCGTVLADVQVAPVPWIPDSGDAKTGTLSGGINFRGVSSNSEISIYTINGYLVRRISNTTTDPANWDGRNSSGQYVASGVYLWVVKNTGKTQTGKLIVVR